MARTSTGTGGNWSSNSTWAEGSPPANTDAVTIAAGTPVTIDNTSCVALSVTVQAGGVGVVGGILNLASGVDTALTVQNGITNTYVDGTVGSTRNGRVDFDKSGDPTHTFTLSLNGARSTTAGAGRFSSTGRLTLKGAARTRHTTIKAGTGGLTGGTSMGCTVTDATGWRVGDTLVFATTQAYPAAQSYATSDMSGDGTYVTVTAANFGTNIVKGENIWLNEVQTNMVGAYVVYDVLSTTQFRIQSAVASWTDKVGTVYLAPRTDLVTIASVDTGTGVITWTDGRGAGGAVAHDHAAECVVVNLTSNLIIQPANVGDYSNTSIANGYASAGADVIDHVCFKGAGIGSDYQGAALCFYGSNINGIGSVSNNAFWNCYGYGGYETFYSSQSSRTTTTIVMQNNVHYNEASYSSGIAQSNTTYPLDFYDDNRVALRFSVSVFKPTTTGPKPRGWQVSGQFKHTSYNPAATLASGVSMPAVYENCDFWSCKLIADTNSAGQFPGAILNNCTFGTKYSGAVNGMLFEWGGDYQIIANDCYFDTTGAVFNSSYLAINPSSVAFVKLLNKDGDPAVQEIYTNQSATVPAIQRQAGASPQKYTRSTSAIEFSSGRDLPITQEQAVLAKNGESVKVLAYLMILHAAPAYGASTLPSIALSGLGITPQTSTYTDVSTGTQSMSVTGGNTYSWPGGDFTALFAAGDSVYVEGFAADANNGTKTVVSRTAEALVVAEALTNVASASGKFISKWFKAEVNATQSSGADGNLTLTLTAQSAVAGAKAWFAGVPFSPFISRCRHYGYLFDETVPVRTANITTSATESAAQAIAGVAITGGAVTSDTVISANRTFQELYDYSQAWACLNVSLAVAFTGAGLAGSPSLFANGDVTVNSGYALSGPGSLTMGSAMLLALFDGGIPYTYTGGLYSQPATTPTFSGGTLELTDAGTYEFAAVATTINFDPAAPTTYDLSGSTFSGAIVLHNLSATHAITISLPSGVDYSTTTAGGTVTITAPQIYQSVTVSGCVAGSRIQIYDTTAGAELYNGVPASFPHTWTDSVAAAANRTIRLRVAYCAAPSGGSYTNGEGSGGDFTDCCMDFIDANIGTCGTTDGTKAVSYLVSQVVDDIYVANGKDGTTITDCAIVSTNLHIDIDNAGGGTYGETTWQHVYAYMSYWLSTAGGIADQALEMVANTQTDYVFLSAGGTFKVKNVTSPSVPLVISGGNAAPDSGAVVTILDLTGGTIFCIEGTVVPFVYSTSDQALNLATALEAIDDRFNFTVAGNVDANIQYVNDVQVSGNGSDATPWGPA